MNISSWFSENFGNTSKGLMSVLQTLQGLDCLPDGSFGLYGKLLVLEYKPKKLDYYQIAVGKTQIKLTSGSAAGFFVALGQLREQVSASSLENKQVEMPFQHRLYKLEGKFSRGDDSKESTEDYRIVITKITDLFWHSFCQNLVVRGFTSLVLYIDNYHPFEHFLDYRGFPHGANAKTAELRKKNFTTLQNLLRIAKEYGLESFMQHYVSHFTQVLSDHLKLGIDSGGSRLANFDHPEIDAYTRYIYHQTFTSLPELDGLIFNFESCGNSKEFLQRTLIKVVSKLKRKPILYFRLWGITEIDAIKDVIDLYDGPVRLMHKSQESNDVYYYPVADERVKLWKKALPHVEFSFSLGPCHNCATNLSDKLWADPEYIQQLMESIIDKGADSVSFQATRDLSTYFLKGNEIISERNKNHSKHNFGHLEAFCDFIKNRKLKSNDWALRYADIYQCSADVGKIIYEGVLHASRVILLHKLQYCAGSFSEGFLFPGRFSFYQDPFFYYPMSSINTFNEIKYNLGMTAWLKRTKPVHSVPDDTQYVMDYINPAVVKKVKNNPSVIAKRIREHNKKIYVIASLYKKKMGKKADVSLLEKMLANANWGERVWREIEVSIILSRAYFAKTKNIFFAELKEACKLLRDAEKVVDIPSSQEFLNINGSGNFTPLQDAEEIAQIIKHEIESFPFKALQLYLLSFVQFHEIKRLMRPYSSMRNEKITYASKLIRQAMVGAEKALALLQEQKHAVYHQGVVQWLRYLQNELLSLNPPAMICYREDKVAVDAHFQRLNHDQCFLYGEKCWEDFAGFFEPKNYFRQDNLECRTTWSEKGFVISLKENAIVWPEREAVWAKNTGTINQTGFLQIFIEDGLTCKKMQALTLYFKGEGGRESYVEEILNCKQIDSKSTLLKDYSVNFQHTDSTWRVDVTLPWERFDKTPKVGDVWRFNLFSNPAVKRNHRGIWCQGYEMFNDVTRLGYVYFQ